MIYVIIIAFVILCLVIYSRIEYYANEFPQEFKIVKLVNDDYIIMIKNNLNNNWRTARYIPKGNSKRLIYRKGNNLTYYSILGNFIEYNDAVKCIKNHHHLISRLYPEIAIECDVTHFDKYFNKKQVKQKLIKQLAESIHNDDVEQVEKIMNQIIN